MTHPDISHYRTITNPEEFHLDWKAFYPSAYARGQALRARWRHTAGVAYGDEAAQVMNIYYPEEVRRDAVVFVYLHGGAFQEGHPDFYDFVGESLLRRGAIFVSMGYRLAPIRFPTSAHDVARGLTALQGALQAKGVAATRYCLSGHSAGAAIAALLSVRPDILDSADFNHDLIDSTVLLSGIYDFRPPEISQNFVDPEWRDYASPVLHCNHAPKHTILVYGLPEINLKVSNPESFRNRAHLFATTLKEQGHQATLVELAETNHMDTASVLDRDEVLSVICTVLGLPSRVETAES
ncbi:MAG: alpha/beta hydrolase [Pigmentiphaga sp.]